MMPAYTHYKPHLRANVVVFIIVVLILSCKKESTNTAPIANAGANVYVILPTDSSLLKGSATDEDANNLSYTWRNISGPVGATIVNPNSAQTVLRNLKAGEYVFEFSVSDTYGLKSSDTTKVFVIQRGQNEIIFKNLKWGCPMGCTVVVNNFNSAVPSGLPYLVFLRVSSLLDWQTVHPLTEWTDAVKYVYYFDDNRNELVIYTDDEIGAVDVKIQF